MCPASPDGGCGPHFSFVLPKEKSPPQRWKRKTLGRINLTQRCQVDRKYEGRRGRCGANLPARTGCAPHRWNKDSPPPHLWAPTCFRGGQRKVCPLSPARSASLRATPSPGGESKGEGPQPRPFVSLGGVGAESKRPHVSGGGLRGRCLCAKDISPFSPVRPGRGAFPRPRQGRKKRTGRSLFSLLIP